ncbi:MAG TPA: protein kinase [Terriglobales bacterium]|nr:protein kinase [Terriglobales bacterium]
METRADWQRIKELFGQALEYPSEQRDAFLNNACGSDTSLRQEVESLLKAHDSSTALLQEPLIPISSATKNRSVGPYRLLEKIGEGGMGQVWLAERTDGTLKRQVAIKLPHEGFQSAAFVKRFARERDILASLSHPHIATLYDAGVAEGQPFLAMEYVVGETITAYSARLNLAVRDRLQLFQQVLAAVQYAHSHLVVHRDLKPSNILVTPDGQVKLLDFGIAKLIGTGETAETELTQLGGRMLTPDYASPEQITGAPISTTTDVYALGVVLYELLTGFRPWKRSSRGMLEDAILHADPAPPSSVAVKSKKALRGDLDAIVLKALRKEPGQRYATADAFAEDLRRFLIGDPVIAQPESAWYRTRKFLIRQRWAVLSAAAIVLALALGLGLALWQAHIARRETTVATAMEKFLEDIFRANSSDQQDPVKARQTTARELLDIGAGKIDGELAGVPEANLRILSTLGDMYFDLGLDDQAVEMQRKRVAVARRQFGNNSEELASALIDLGDALHSSHSVSESEGVLLEANRILDQRRDFGSLERGNLLIMLAQHYRSSDLKRALDYSRQATEVLRRYPTDPELAESLFQQAELLDVLNQPREAETQVTEALQRSIKLQGDPNPNLARFYAGQGQIQQELMEFAAGEDSMRRAAEAARKVNGDDHVDTLETELRLGYFLVATSRPWEGLEHIERAKEIELRIRGEADPFFAPQVFLEYGGALASVGKIEEGLEYISKAVENRRKNRPGTQYLGQMLEREALVQIELGRYEEAQRLSDEAAEIAKKVNYPTSFNAIDGRVRLLLTARQIPEAEAALNSFHPAVPAEGTLSQDALRAQVLRAEIALARNDGETAAGVAGEVTKLLAASPARAYLKWLEARAVLAQGRAELLRHHPSEALPLIQRSVELRESIMDPNSPALADSRVALATCYFELGDPTRATALAAAAQNAFASHRELGKQHTAPLHDLERRLHHISTSQQAYLDHR